MNIISVLLALLVILLPGAAWAQTGGYCENDTSTYVDCDGGGANDVCATTTNDMICTLDINGDTGAATVYAIYVSASGDYEVFGTDAAGNDFCCVDQALDRLNVTGGSYGDTISFFYSSYELVNHSTRNFTPSAAGRDGDDTIYGSNHDSTYYREELHGDNDDDTVHGRAGDDWITGDNDDDTLYGGSGDDSIYGGQGYDVLNGDAHDDYLYGGSQDDVICGGDGTDKLYGNLGNDDELWGSYSGATVGEADDRDGGTTPGNYCDIISTGTRRNCSYNLSSAPAECN